MIEDQASVEIYTPRTVVKTRYRDIPYEEVKDFHRHNDNEETRRRYWDEMRGQEIWIQIPGEYGNSFTGHVPSGCQEMTFVVVGPQKMLELVKHEPGRLVVCSHLAEIGD